MDGFRSHVPAWAPTSRPLDHPDGGEIGCLGAAPSCERSRETLMSIAMQSSKALLAAFLAASVVACEEKPTASEPASAGKKPDASAAPSAPASTPAPSASAPEPRDDCPEGSEGIGSFDKPCKAEGSARLMEVS